MPFPYLLAGKMGLDYLGGRSRRRAAERADRENRAYEMQRFNARMAEEEANRIAREQQFAGLQHAADLGHGGRTEAFELLKEGDKDKKKAQENLTKALADFGIKSKKAHLAQSKAKRSGKVSKAIKGAKIASTAGGAGRGGIRGAIKSAQATGLGRALDTSQMASALGAYGADLSRELGDYNMLAADNKALGNFADWTEKTAKQREILAGRDEAAYTRAATQAYNRQVMDNQRLGPSFLPPQAGNRISRGDSLYNLGSTMLGTYLGEYGEPTWGGGGKKLPDPTMDIGGLDYDRNYAVRY